MSERLLFTMAPDGHTQTPEPGEAAPEIVPETPITNGILSKGSKVKKRVTFRDSKLCTYKEIPPRSRSGSSSESGESDDEDEDSDSGSDDDDDSDSGSDDDDDGDNGNAAKTVAKAKAAVPLARPSHVTSAPSVSVVHHGPRVRPERAPIVWSSTTTFSVPKGSYDVSTSPANRVVSLVSQITGVSTAAAHAHLKQRTSPPTPKPATAAAVAPVKKPAPVVKVEKKVKKITPTLDGLLSPQTLKVGHRNGASDSASKGASNKTVKKKRVSAKKSDSNDKRKTTSRKAKDSKHAASRANTPSPVPGKLKLVQSSPSQLAASVRDSLSLPRLAGDDTLVTQSSRNLQQLSIGKLYTLDGFIFPGDPAHDLAQGVKAGAIPSPRLSDPKPYTSISPTPGASPRQHPRERVNSAPPGSASRRKRYYAWQMANGNMHSTLQETPCIAPMWETVQTVSTLPSKSGSLTDR